MRFVLTSVAKCSGRLGQICELERLPDLVLETPLLLMYTKGGCIPHVARDVLLMLADEPLAVQIPVAAILESKEAVLEFGVGIGKFVGLHNHLLYCTLQDPGIYTSRGFHDKDVVSLFPRRGREQMDCNSYMDMMDSIQPDMYQALSDGNTDINSGKKRIQKSAQRTSQFFKICTDRHNSSTVLKNAKMLGVLEGGYSIPAREMCARELAYSPVPGFVIDGLHANGPDVENLPFEEVKPVVEGALKYLPEGKFRVAHGSWNPDTVLDLVELGIDVFDSSYPTLVTERGGALIFPYLASEGGEAQNASARSQENPTETDGDYRECVDVENGKEIPSGEINGAKNPEESNASSHPYEMNLNDDKYCADYQPICESCTCNSCEKYTRAYINHLLDSNEMLAHVLLMAHNLHHYMEFFKNMRKALKEDTWKDFRLCVSQGRHA